jgi:hypothetical protein
MHKGYPVTLTRDQREHLEDLIVAGADPARKLIHARISLNASQGPAGLGWVATAIAEAVEVSQPTIARVRRQYVEQGLEAALNRRPPRREYRRKPDGAQEARLVAVACSSPPEEQARWSLRLLADRQVELEVVESVSYQTTRGARKTSCRPGARSSG